MAYKHAHIKLQVYIHAHTNTNDIEWVRVKIHAGVVLRTFFLITTLRRHCRATLVGDLGIGLAS